MTKKVKASELQVGDTLIKGQRKTNCTWEAFSGTITAIEPRIIEGHDHIQVRLNGNSSGGYYYVGTDYEQANFIVSKNP